MIALTLLFVELVKEGPGMNLISGWPILVVLGLTALAIAGWADSRTRTIVNWLLLPILLEGALMDWFYTSLR